MRRRKSKLLLAVLGLFLCWALFVAAEGVRLIGSTDPGVYPLIRLGGLQAADQCAEYQSLGFTQYYQLTEGDEFVSGEFRVLGIPVARWE